jgi:hypothetical protein
MAVSINGTTGITTPGIDADSGTMGTLTAAVTASPLIVGDDNISASNSLGFRNRIINGDMRIDQRNAGASVTPTDGQYTLDRWRFGLNQASKFSAQQSTAAPTGFTNSLLVTSLSAYSIGVSDLFLTEQRIEGFNFSDLGWGTANAQTVTLSFWVRSSLTGTFGGSLRNSDNSRSYPFNYTISSANTFEYKTVTIEGDITGTWVTNNGTGAQVTFGLGVGSDLSGTAGAWVASAKLSATGAVSVVGTSGATFYLTGVQLEAGSVATPFERRPYGTELQLCMRYFFRCEKTRASANGTNAGNYTCAFSHALPVSMRASPTVSTYGSEDNHNYSFVSYENITPQHVSALINIINNGYYYRNVGYNASAEL